MENALWKPKCMRLLSIAFFESPLLGMTHVHSARHYTRQSQEMCAPAYIYVKPTTGPVAYSLFLDREADNGTKWLA